MTLNPLQQNNMTCHDMPILLGQTPEQQLMCSKIDNSQEDPVCGDVIDIIYKVVMPVIIKKNFLTKTMVMRT